MTIAVETLEAEFLKLPSADRTRLLERLVASLEVDHGIEAAWDAVADERDAELESGRVVAPSLEEALARLEARFPG